MVFRKAKSRRKSESLPPPRTLPELVDRLTTGGSNALNTGLLSDLVSRISASNSERDSALQLLFRQMQRPHSQIRCSVVKVLRFLTTEPLQASLTSGIQEAILLHLQDILPYCIPTTNFDKALPPPESAANEMQREMLKMLFQWEREGICSMLSSQARGQLVSVMRYLRTPLKQSGGTARLKDAARMLETLEREEDQRHRRAQMADAVIRRRILAARDAFREHRPLILENVESLEGIVKLLVPDLFQMDESRASEPSSPRDFREHGFHASGECNSN
ncbi:UV-stimulated scaffold protein A [Taenia crassiceps]|uniref:UV-stimulated scaffold protein A n=1 Tax=Taenia crassiceps TaxID=6207 RepID=A0ABR4QD24_9CEST